MTSLENLEQIRPKILSDVSTRTRRDFDGAAIDSVLEEALFLERVRMNRIAPLAPGNWFLIPRLMSDKKLWRKVQSGLLKRVGESDRPRLFQAVTEHYAEEIGGHFNPKIYDLAIRMVPYGFNWLLNAASLRHFRPWGHTQLLQNRVKVLGEIESLQKLSKKGTILLVPTHQSNIDSVLIGYLIYLIGLPPFCYGAGLNLFTNPLLGFFMSSLGAYTVDRAKTSSLYKGVLKNYSTRIIEEGLHSIFFPGGGRSRSGAIESKPKLGLMGTALSAQIANLQAGKPNPNVYIVPMVISYDFVLEASSLIDGYLAQLGKQRFLGADTEGSLPIIKGLKFFWRFFKSESGLIARVGRALDVFGNPVDDDGNSIGPNNTKVDVSKWLTTRGELRSNNGRDKEYTRELGQRLVDSYYQNNVVRATQLAPFVFFHMLRKKYPEMDLFRLMRLSISQRSLPMDKYLEEAARMHERMRHMADRGELFLSDELRTSDTRAWVMDGIKHLGAYHENAVLKLDQDVIYTEDMSLLYYYRNRLSGYGLSMMEDFGDVKTDRGVPDEKGFLA